MRTFFTTLTALATLAPLPVLAQSATYAAPTPEFPYAAAKDIAAAVAKLKREKKEGQVFALELFKQLEPYTALVQYNTGQFTAQPHEKDSEFFYVLEGSGTAVMGGKLVNEKKGDGDGNFNGTDVTGGKEIQVSKGDILIAPPKTVHWFKTIKEPLMMIAFHTVPKETK